MTTATKFVAICIATYKRPALLSRCLHAIENLILPVKTEILVVVVDNDIAKTGKQTIDETRSGLSMPLYYFVEDVRGIASARNRLLKEAVAKKAEYIAFMDDDEFPEKTWLQNAFLILDKYNADVVTGPVVALSEEGEVTSTTQGKYTDGQAPRKVSTNNVLFKIKLVTTDQLQFDLRLNLTGGEDFEYFDRSLTKGNKHVWAEDAVVYETIVKERTTKKYLFYRHFTGAINNVIQYKHNKGALAAWLHFFFKIIGKAFGALLTFITYIFTFNKKKLEKSIVKLASSLGYMSGLLNIVIERYR
jgi:glycosyltransferase involved in cell wall biosynthesis